MWKADCCHGRLLKCLFSLAKYFGSLEYRSPGEWSHAKHFSLYNLQILHHLLNVPRRNLHTPYLFPQQSYTICPRGNASLQNDCILPLIVTINLKADVQQPVTTLLLSIPLQMQILQKVPPIPRIYFQRLRPGNNCAQGCLEKSWGRFWSTHHLLIAIRKLCGLSVPFVHGWKGLYRCAGGTWSTCWVNTKKMSGILISPVHFHFERPFAPWK